MACICWSIRWTPCGVAVSGFLWRACAILSTWARTAHRPLAFCHDFVIPPTHTPYYAEDVPVTNSDLILAGHTHGGQVTLLRLSPPIVPSHYGQRFLSGLKYNSKNIPMIVTNGIGTSQKAIRMFAPAEVVMIVLHRLMVSIILLGISTTPSFFLPSIFTTIGWWKCTCRRYFVSCTAGCAFRNSWL